MIIGIAKGVWAALIGKDYAEHIKIAREDFAPSFIAIGLSLLAFIFCGFASARVVGGGASTPLAGLVIILGLSLLTFPLIAYLIAQLISRMDIFRPWVIVRNWAFLCAAILMACIMGLNFVGILPFQIAILLTMMAYVSTLIIDIRLAQTVAEMTWTPAIISACVITFASLLVLLAGFATLAGY